MELFGGESITTRETNDGVEVSTVVANPSFLDVNTWRRVVQNNADIYGIDFLIVTNDKWLPKVMTEAGFFGSGSQVKKNRPDLWREIVDNEWFKFGGWCRIRICVISYDPCEI